MSKPYDGPGAIVRYDGAPHGSDYHYLTHIGYWNGIINLRTYSKEPKPLKMNGGFVNDGHVVSPWIAKSMVQKIHEQFTHEKFNYTITDVLPTSK